MTSRSALAVFGFVALGYLVAPSTAAQVTLVSPNAMPLGFGNAVGRMPTASGVDAIVVGARGETVDGITRAGRTYVFDADGSVRLTLASPTPRPSGAFGRAVVGIEDLDGDGEGDLLVGAEFENGGGIDRAGAVHVFSGANGTRLRTLLSPDAAPASQFGQAVAVVEDLDGDGLEDVLVAAPREEVGGVEAGQVHIVSSATGARIRTLSSPTPAMRGAGFEGFGTGLSAVPDVDGDSVEDVLVGSEVETVDGVAEGLAHLFSGATGAFLRSVASPSGASNGRFGRAVAGLADVDGDGAGDFAVSAVTEYEPGTTTRIGRVHVFSGATGALLHSLDPASGLPSAQFGVSIARAPDLDGDGRDELVVGAFAEPTADFRVRGRVYVFDSATGTAVESFGAAPLMTTNLGTSVAVAQGADGLLVLAGAEEAGPDQSGRAYVFAPTPVAAVEAPRPPGVELAATPNPARQLVLTLRLVEPQTVRLSLLDVRGRELAVLASGPRAAGAHAIPVPVGLAPGVYVARATTETESRTIRLTLLP